MVDMESSMRLIVWWQSKTYFANTDSKRAMLTDVIKDSYGDLYNEMPVKCVFPALEGQSKKVSVANLEAELKRINLDISKLAQYSRLDVNFDNRGSKRLLMIQGNNMHREFIPLDLPLYSVRNLRQEVC